MKHAQPSHAGTVIAHILTGVILLLLIVVAYFILKPDGRLNCRSFGTYEEMEYAFLQGATYLDRDADSIPCESFKKP